MILAAVAVLLTGGVLAFPSVTKDRTCHNMFRDGRRSITPKVNMDLQIAKEDWPKLTKVVEDFAAAHEQSLRNSSRTSPGFAQILYLSLCNDRGTNITVDEHRWAEPELKTLFAGRGVSIAVYETREGSGWERAARDLVAELESMWPGKVQFRGDSGQIIPMPRELQGADAPALPSAAPRN